MVDPVRAAVGALVVGGAAFVAGRRAAHTEDPDCDLGSSIVQLRQLPPPREDGRRTAAFFDVDGTLYSLRGDPTGGGTALLHMFRISQKYDALKGKALGVMLLPVVLAMLVLDKTDRAFSMWFMTTLSLHGVDVALVEASMRTFCASELFKSMILESVRAQLERHRAAGHLIILVSASSLVVTQPIADFFGAHIVCGSICPQEAAEVGAQQGEEARMKFARAHYRNALLVGDVKQRLLARLFEQCAIDAPSSFAYSDHPTDAPMLRAVGNAVAANPTGKMRRLAAAEGWAVLEGESNVEGGSYKRESSSDIADLAVRITAALHQDYTIPSGGAVQGTLGILSALPVLFSSAFATESSGTSKL